MIRSRLTRTRLFRSDERNILFTVSGPGRCRRALEILGLENPKRLSGLSPRELSMDDGALVCAIFLTRIFSVIENFWASQTSQWNSVRRHHIDAEICRWEQHPLPLDYCRNGSFAKTVRCLAINDSIPLPA